MKIPVTNRHRPDVSNAQTNKARALAKQILTEKSNLNWKHDDFCDFVVDGEITDAPTLHLDDFSEIPVIGDNDNSRILQQRARLRACDKDWVAQSRTIERGFSDYCEYQLGLGRVKWLYPADPESDTRHIALDCWRDRRLRHDLEQAVRHEGLRYIHPHISTHNVWELAALLHDLTRMPISVIGPTPAFANWANDKIEFSLAVERLLGEEFVPQTESAYNFASLSKQVARLADTNNQLAIKFPYGTGGHGNFMFDALHVRGRSLKQVRNYLKELLHGTRWPDKGRVLIDVWEDDVLSSPSIQVWIPPQDCGEPLVEGVFVQEVVGEKGHFLGSRQANFSNQLEQQIVDQGFLLANLFQHLGYVGRCSFDLILVGESVNECRVEFIESNSRWGGTSSPMTLANRIGLSREQKYSIGRVDVPDLWKMEFSELQRELRAELYDPTTGKGWLVLFNPARIKEHSCMEALTIANSMEEAQSLLNDWLPNRLISIVGASVNPASPSGGPLGHASFGHFKVGL